MMEGRCDLSFAAMYLGNCFSLKRFHTHSAAFGEMFAGQVWPMEHLWITMCFLVFSSSTFTAARSLLLVQHPCMRVSLIVFMCVDLIAFR
jgi:hypothetical protein